MSERNQLSLGKQSLPGDRQGTSGVGAGRDSMRDTNGRTLRRRAPAIQKATPLDEEDIDEERVQVVGRIGIQSSQEHPVVGTGSRNRTAQRGRHKWTPEQHSLLSALYRRSGLSLIHISEPTRPY